MIQETIALKNQVSPVANSAAAAVDRLRKATERAQKSLGSSPKQALAGMRAEHRAVAKLQQIKQRATREAVAAQTKERAQVKQNDAAFKKLGIGVAAAAVAIGVAAVAAVKGVADLAVEFGEALSAAKLTRDAALGMANALTGGKGAETLKGLDRMTLALGVSLADGRKQFEEFSKATGSTKSAVGLIKLRADLVATKMPLTDVDAAIQKVLDAPPGKTTQAMRDVAKAAGVAGDGALAAKKSYTSWEGAVKRVKEASGRIFDRAAEIAGPSLDKIGGAVNKMLTEFQKSKEGQVAMSGLKSAVLGILAGVEKAIPLVIPFFKGFAAAVAPVAAMLKPIGKALAAAFGDDTTANMKTAETVGKALGVTLTILGVMALAALTPIVAPMIAIGVAAGWIGSKVGALVATAGMIAKDFPSLIGAGIQRAKAWLDLIVIAAGTAAGQMIAGLVSGITGGVGKVVEAVKGLASRLTSTFTSALKIGSPSKLFEDFGGNTTEGFGRGVKRTTSSAVGAVSDMAGAVATGGATAAPAGGGGGAVSLTVNVSVGAGGGGQEGRALGAEIAAAVRREIEVLSQRHAWEGAR